MGFKELKPEELNVNPFTLIGKEWLLITAGNKDKFNTMTASWGGLGVFWNKNVATIYIRSTRYTKEFVDSNDTFTISFYDESYKKALGVCGRTSGRDVDKVKETGLTPVFGDGAPYFQEAKLVITCKKLFHTNITPDTMDQKEFDELVYPAKDYHTLYIGEILKVLEQE